MIWFFFSRFFFIFVSFAYKNLGTYSTTTVPLSRTSLKSVKKWCANVQAGLFGVLKIVIEKVAETDNLS